MCPERIHHIYQKNTKLLGNVLGFALIQTNLLKIVQSLESLGSPKKKKCMFWTGFEAGRLVVRKETLNKHKPLTDCWQRIAIDIPFKRETAGKMVISYNSCQFSVISFQSQEVFGNNSPMFGIFQDTGSLLQEISVRVGLPNPYDNR